MKLNISYIRPCGERNKLAARLEFNGDFDMEKLRESFKVQLSKELNVIKFQIENKDILISDGHIDIRNAEKEHEILKIIETMKQFLKETS